jgi:periplasmic divalent cation tolerance protein
MTDIIVILSTCATRGEAEKLARLLLEERLAACVNVIPHIRSYYRWKGAIESADECLLVVKSSRELFSSLSAVLEKEHSYEVPEVLALPIVEGATDYLNWLLANLRSGPEPGTG